MVASSQGAVKEKRLESLQNAEPSTRIFLMKLIFITLDLVAPVQDAGSHRRRGGRSARALHETVGI